MNTESRKEIIQRTLENLRCINAIKTLQGTAGEKVSPFELTQLVNSFLMTLIQNWDDLEKTWAQLKQGKIQWPKLSTSSPNQQAWQCIKHIRNALAHGLFVFEGKPNGRIQALHLWTCKQSKLKEVGWHAEITVDQMRQMLDCFVVVAAQHNLPARKAKRKGDPCQ